LLNLSEFDTVVVEFDLPVDPAEDCQIAAFRDLAQVTGMIAALVTGY